MVFKRSEAAASLSIFPDFLPCGQCFGCRLDYSCDWAMRCDKETQMHDRSCFVTLTYGESHVPGDRGLVLSDWQDFMKRLRKRFGAGLSYFHAGEYGGKYGRPHEHAILFGVDFSDRVFFKKTLSGSSIDTSKTLESLWPFGFSSVGNATFESAAYLARYCMKKISGKAKDLVDSNGLKFNERMLDSGEVVEVRPEYVTMSRNPAIGRRWFDKFWSDVFPHDYVVCRGGMKMPPPKYFDSLYEAKNPLDMKRIKGLRLARCSKKEEVWNETLQKIQWLDCARSERLQVMEEFMKSKFSLYSKSLEA